MAGKKTGPDVETKKTETTETETTETTNNVEYVTKLNIKALGCDPRLDKNVARKLLCRIYGTAQGLKHGEDGSGKVWTALVGNFEGVNIEEGSDDIGVVVRSGKLFLPEGIQGLIEGAIKEIENTAGGKEEASVTFALEIASIRAQNPIGYSYAAKNLAPVKKEDPLGELRKLIGPPPPKAIPAPAAKS